MICFIACIRDHIGEDINASPRGRVEGRALYPLEVLLSWEHRQPGEGVQDTPPPAKPCHFGVFTPWR